MAGRRNLFLLLLLRLLLRPTCKITYCISYQILENDDNWFPFFLFFFFVFIFCLFCFISPTQKDIASVVITGIVVARCSITPRRWRYPPRQYTRRRWPSEFCLLSLLLIGRGEDVNNRPNGYSYVIFLAVSFQWMSIRWLGHVMFSLSPTALGH